MKPYKKTITALRSAAFQLVAQGQVGLMYEVNHVPWNAPDFHGGEYIRDKELRDRARPGEIWSVGCWSNAGNMMSLHGHGYMLVPTRELAAEYPPEYWVSEDSLTLEEKAEKHNLPDPFEGERE